MPARGYRAGRVFLQVVPSYDHFLKTLKQDARGSLGKAIADVFEQELGRQGYQSGEKFGKELSKGIEKSVRTDSVTQKFRKTMRDAARDLDAVGESADHLSRGIRELEKDMDKSGRATDRHIQRARHLGTEMVKLARTTGDAANKQRLLNAARGFNPDSMRDYSRELRNMERDSDRGEKATRRLRRSILDLGVDSQSGANGFRFFNFAVLAFAALGPTLVPIIAAIGGALLALGPILMSLGAAAGVAIFGLSGIGDAVKALGDQEKASSASSLAYQRQLVNAARAVADARRSLQDAYRNSAERIRDALERQRDAERNLTRAQRDAAEAQQNLTAARKEAQQDQEDLSNKIAQNALDERQAVIDLFEAYNRYGAVQADGGSTNLEREQADIGLKQAQLNIKMIREEQKRLADEKKKSDKDGINGSEKVRRAEDRLRDALERVDDAQRRVAKSTRDVTEARRDGARAISDAQRNLQRAQEDYNYALQGGIEAVDKLNQAMGELGPAGQKFARFIFALKKDFVELRKEVQEGFLPGLQAGMETVIAHYGPGFRKFLIDTAKLLGDISERSAEAFTNPYWSKFFSDMAEYSGIFISDFADAMMNWFEGFANILGMALPTAESFSGAMRSMSEQFRDWTRSEKGREGVSKFLGYVAKAGPAVRDLIGAIGRALGNMGEALGGIGLAIVNGLTNFFDFLGRIDPGAATLIFTGLSALIVALQVSSGLTAFAAILGIIAGSPFLLAVVAITALAGAFVLLRNSGGEIGEKIRDFEKSLKPAVDVVKRLASLVKDELVKVWEDHLQPALEKIGKTVKEDLIPALNDLMVFLEPILEWLIKNFFEGLGDAFDFMGTLISGLIKILSGVINFITGVFTGDWDKAWKGIKQIVSGAKDIIVGIFDSIWKSAKRIFGGLLDTVGEIFTAIGKAIGKPIVAVLDLVINKGLIGGINTIAGWIGLGEKNSDGKRQLIKPIPKPKGFATGGVLPGFTPGRDVHRFISPTGGMLDLSGGEAVMRPEFTRAVGGEKGVARLNDLARRGMAFAKGGVIWPTRGKHWTTYTGHDGIDLNGKGNGLGQPYFATEDGRVVYTGSGRGYGNKVELLTKSGKTVIYGHSSEINVKKGQKVNQGQILGLIGYSGHVIPAGPAGSHLHFGLKGEPRDEGAAIIKYLMGSIFKGSGFKGLLGAVGGLSKAAIAAIKNPAKYLSGRVADGFKQIGGADTGILKMLKAVPGKLIGGVSNKLKDLAKDALGVGASWFTAGVQPLKSVFSGIGRGIDAVNPFGGQAKLYDNGGYLPPGMSTIFNATGRPEPVFSPDQWDSIRDRVEGGGDHYDIRATGADPRAVVRDLMSELRRERRRARRSGTLSSRVKPT